MKYNMLSEHPEKTKKIGKELAGLLMPGDNIILNGPLGSGKTLFTKGVASGLGIIRPEYVNSPSFVIVKEYKGRINLYHFDLYRLDDIEDIQYMGMDEYINGNGVVVIEWAERMKGLLPEDYLDITIGIIGDEKRSFYFKPFGKRYDYIISRYFKQQV